MTEVLTLKQCKIAFVELREQLVRILGTTTVDLIIERAAVEVIHTYPAMALIGLTGHVVQFAAADAALEGKSDAEVSAAFGALQGVMLLILARLLGKEMTARLAPAHDVSGYLEGRS